MTAKNPPGKMLARLVELMAKGGFMLFSTYTRELMFTKEMASSAGFFAFASNSSLVIVGGSLSMGLPPVTLSRCHVSRYSLRYESV